MSANSTELLPCPFCGDDADIYTPNFPMIGDCDDIYVGCKRCDSMGPQVLFDKDVHDADDLDDLTAEAIAAWNTRATPSPATGQVERMREDASPQAEVERSGGEQ